MKEAEKELWSFACSVERMVLNGNFPTARSYSDLPEAYRKVLTDVAADMRKLYVRDRERTSLDEALERVLDSDGVLTPKDLAVILSDAIRDAKDKGAPELVIRAIKELMNIHAKSEPDDDRDAEDLESYLMARRAKTLTPASDNQGADRGPDDDPVAEPESNTSQRP